MDDDTRQDAGRGGPAGTQSDLAAVHTLRLHEQAVRLGAAVLGLVMAVLIAIPISLLPATWRERIDDHKRLPLLLGTALSALLQLSAALVLLIPAHSFFHQADAGPLASTIYDHYGWFFTINLYFILESGVRLLSALAVGEALGTLPIWLCERAYVAQNPAGGERGWLPSGPMVDPALPRARLLRRKNQPN
jgi:hypothetical protein